MMFTLLPTVTPWVVAFLVIAALGVILAAIAVTDSLVRNRRTRTARGESLRTYYTGRLALHH